MPMLEKLLTVASTLPKDAAGAALVGRVDRGFHFLEGVGLEAGDVIIGAGGAVHLDPVRSGRKLLPGRPLDFSYAVGAARIRLGDASEAGDLLDAEAYKSFVAEQ